MIWIVLLAIITGMGLDLAYPECARGGVTRSERIALGDGSDLEWWEHERERDPWIDFGGES